MRITYGGGQLFIDLDLDQVTRDGKPVTLTRLEWGLLRVLVSYAGWVMTVRRLLQEVWGPDYGNEDHYVRNYIRRLRRKLEPDPHNPRYILLDRGIGYRMVVPDQVTYAGPPSILTRPDAS